MKKLNEENCCEVLNLSQIKKKCSKVIHHCDICEGVIIDDDKVPEKYIVDYNDRKIYSAMLTCAKCGRKICEKCATYIEDTWEKVCICNDCAEKYEKRIKRIRKLQKKAELLTEEIEEEIGEFLYGKS